MTRMRAQFTWLAVYLQVFMISFNCGFLFWMHAYDSTETIEVYNLSTTDEHSMIKLMHHAVDQNASIIDQLYFKYQSRRSEAIEKNVRILCWVCTCQKSHHTKAIHVKYTWGRRCDKLIFISESQDDILPTIAVHANPKRIGLTMKTVRAFQYIYKNYFEEYDWFLKADDDSYVVIENLRKMLAAYDSEKPEYLGLQMKNPDPRWKYIAPDGYMTGAAYVLSRESLKRFATRAFVGNSLKCPLVYLNHESEDILIAQCMLYVGGHSVDTRDSEGNLRISHFDIDDYVNGIPPENPLIEPETWFHRHIMWSYHEGGQRSKKSIAFHHMQPHKFYLLENVLYSTQVVGVKNVVRVERDKSTLAEPSRMKIIMELGRNKTLRRMLIQQNGLLWKNAV